MNKLKRFLALVLAMSMMLTLVPFGVFAAVASAPTTNLSTENAPFKQGTGESNSFRIPAIVTLSDGTLVAAADARWNTTYDGGGLDTMVAVSTDDGATWTHSFANYLGDNSNSYNYNSTCFIDPSLAVTDDDTIYMLCDLYPYGVALNGNGSQTAPKYDTGFNDSGYLALSADNHGSYSYYLKDGKIYSGDTVVDGLTVDAYFNVTGTYNGTTYDTNLFFSDSPFKVARTGFLYLTKGTYDSTSKTISWSAPQLLNLKTGDEQVCLVGPGRGLVTSGGTIYFPVYSYDGETKKYTGLVYSSDGTNWTRTDNFTDEISSEAALVELDNGNIRVFFRNEKSELRYTDYSTYFGFGDSVSTGVKVNSDTELSAISYSKTINGNQVILVSAPAGPNAAGTNDNNGAYRSSGKIFCGIADKTDSVRTMTWKTGSVGVTPVATGAFSGSTYTAAQGFFAYSCLTELDNNSVAILYEDNQYGWGAGDSNYYTLAYKTYTESELQTAFGVTFDGNTSSGGDTDDDTTTGNTVDVTLKVGETANKTISGVSLNGSHTDSVAEVTWVGSTYATATLGSDANYTGDTINVADCLYTFTKNDAGNWVINRGDVYLNTNGSTGYPHGTTACAFNIAAGYEAGTFYIHSTADSNTSSKTNYLYFDRSAKNWNRVDNLNNNATWMANCSMSLFRVAQGEGSGEIYGYEKVTSVDDITEGQYLIGAMASDNNWYIAYPSIVTTTRYNQIAKIGETVNTNEGTTTLTKVTTVTSGSAYYISDGNGNFLTLSNGALTNSTDIANATQWTLTLVDTPSWGNGASRYTVTSNGYYVNNSGTELGVATSTTNTNHWYTADNGFYGSSGGSAGWLYDSTSSSWTVNDSGYGNANVYTAVTSDATTSTAVTIKGVAPGYTEVTVGTTQYNITVNSATATATVDVELQVGETKKYTETSGAYTTATTNPDTAIAKMELNVVAGTTETTVSSTKATALEDGATYIIRVFDTTYALSSDSGSGAWGTSTLAFQSNTLTAEEKHLWTLEKVDGGYKLKNASGYLNLGTGNNSAYLDETGEVFTITYTDTGWTIGNQSGRYINALGGLTTYYSAGGWTGDGTRFDLYKVTTATAASTEVSFTGVSAGKTVAVVGNTQYNITVTASDGEYVELEVGETLTYTDTTGNYVDAENTKYPNDTYASMTLEPGMALKTVTALESGKQYLIVNKVTGAVLTDTEMKVTGDYGNKDGLATTGSASADSKELWTITSVDGGYTVEQGGKYLAVAGFEAHMYETEVPLTLSHTLDGWLIYDYTTGPALGHADAGYYLTDNAGSNYVNGALGTSATDNTYRYWDIYEILPLNTEISFTGNAIGETTATVGGTTYYITVEEYILDDEINDSSNGYTVNAELQRARYNELIKNVAKDLYTDESWPAYEAARKAAFAKLGEVDGTTYATEAEAQAAVAELVAAIDALEAAKKTLVAAQTITIHYQLDGTTILTEEYKVAADATTLTLPEVIVVDKQTYTISDQQYSNDEDETIIITDGILTLPENDTVVYVAVEKGVVLGDGFVASGDISADGDYVGTGAQIADLIKDDGTAMKITEMTLTTGFSYNLDLASDTTGYTVEWSSDNTDVATVDQDGNVTAVAAGTANVIATVKDADGNVVEVNSIPVTVFTSATTDRVAAVYIENIENTTVYCVVNADTDAKAFQVIEGELIYGKFDTTVSDGSATTAFSFFGDPDEAHALVAMTSTNSFGDYYLLHDDDGNLGIGTEYYRLPDNTTGAGYWQAIGLTDNNHDGKADWTKIEAMINWAIANGCDGGMGFTRRQDEGNIGTNLTFVSDPMPKIEKEVDGVLPTSRLRADYRRYTDGMVAAVHELVYFKLTVTLERPIVWETDSDGNVVTSTDEDGNVYKHGAIEYTNAIVEDTVLKGAYIYTKELDQADGVYDGEIEEDYRTQTQDITDQLNAPWADDEKVRTLELYLLYEIQESDIPKFYIDNIAYLNYNYESHYSTGAQAGAADAEARISVVGSAIDNVVIDFGQSFVYEGHEYTSITDGNSYTFEGLTNVHLKGAFVDGENDFDGITESKATAKYGDVRVTRTATGELDDKGYPEYTYTVTYTPTQILLGVDTVLIYGYGDNNQEKIINGFLVYPATTVYYEEGFILNGNSTWSNAGSAKATVNQTFELLGASQFNEHGELTHKVSNKKHAYGYDPIYNGDGTNDVAKSAITSSTVGDSTTFTFTGDGFEIFADSTASTGKVSVQVKNSAGKFVKVFTVDTAATEGYTGVTVGQTVNLDSLPIVSWHSDNHDTYTVTVQKIAETEPVVIDGVRIFNTLNEADYDNEDGTTNSPFKIDLEDDPDFYQLRDYVLYALNINDKTSVDYKTMCDQVYELMGDAQSAVILDAENPYASVTDSKVYTTTTTKTTVTTVVYNDGTSAVVTRVDTVLEEYSDEAKTQLILVRDDTEDTTVYKNADGDEITREEFGDVSKKTIVSETSAAPVEMAVEGQKTVLTAQDLLDNGPKNELYLHEGESLVFKVKTSRIMQIGLKAPNGETSYTISETSSEFDTISGTLKTSVDMFYELANDIGTETEYIITVTNTGDKILSVTDLKICDDPNAAFTPLTKDDVENVLLSMGYSASCTAGHTYEDGFCSVCGIGSAQNSTTGVEYGTVSEALTAAQSGETVILLTDCTTGNTMVTAGVTLDLNGFNLTASNIVAFDTAHIVDNVGTGTLVTGQKNLVLNESNAMVPVYNGSAYVFSKFGFAVRQDTDYTGEGIKINALACPVNMEVVNLLKDGGEDNNIEIVIRLSWDTDQGTGSQEFKFTDEVVAQVYSSNNGNFAGYSEMFTMVVTGFESIKNLKANAVVVSGTNVDYVSSTSLSITE